MHGTSLWVDNKIKCSSQQWILKRNNIDELYIVFLIGILQIAILYCSSTNFQPSHPVWSSLLYFLNCVCVCARVRVCAQIWVNMWLLFRSMSPIMVNGVFEWMPVVCTEGARLLQSHSQSHHFAVNLFLFLQIAIFHSTWNLMRVCLLVEGLEKEMTQWKRKLFLQAPCSDKARKPPLLGDQLPALPCSALENGKTWGPNILNKPDPRSGNLSILCTVYTVIYFAKSSFHTWKKMKTKLEIHSYIYHKESPTCKLLSAFLIC